MSSAIMVDQVGKKFCKSLKRSMLYGTLDILQSTTGHIADSSVLRKDEFWANDGISFELKKGESLGLIGSNGSGKTTLLRMLNGIFMPDKGKIQINGKVGALIQVGAGFHPMLSGRENIYINGAILGLSKKEIDKKYDSIVEFAEIGEFLDAPVKHYSSGMFVRLGFAVAIHCDPDILLVDEILAVGDKDFQIKCYQKMHEIRKKGVTIVLVSHNEYAIREQTEQCLYLNHGKMVTVGSSEEVISQYLKDVYEHKSQREQAEPPKVSCEDKKAEILSLKFMDHAGGEVSFLETGQELNLVVECRFKEKLNRPIVGVNFYDDNGMMYCANSDYEEVKLTGLKTGRQQVTIKIPQLHIPMNNYLCSVILADENVTNLIDWHDMKYKIVIGRAPNARGLVRLATQWRHS